MRKSSNYRLASEFRTSEACHLILKVSQFATIAVPFAIRRKITVGGCKNFVFLILFELIVKMILSGALSIIRCKI